MAHLSRTPKIEDVATPEAGADTTIAGQLFSVTALSHAVSGSVGGNVAMLAFYPLDQLVMRAQTAGKGKSRNPLSAMKHVLEVEGIGGLYRGLGSTLMTLFAANFIYFYAFHLLRIGFTRNEVSRALGKKLRISRAFFNLALGTLAGAINVAFVQPLWVANARLKLQGTEGHGEARYKGVVDVLCKVYKEEGPTKLWAGVSSSLLLCLNPAIQFAVYETIKKFLVRRNQGAGRETLTSAQAFVLGAFSKWCATLTTYPLQVAQTRLRFQSSSDRSSLAIGNVAYHGTIDCIAKIYKYEGFDGLFRGVQTKLWHSTLISALMFLTYEKIQAAVEGFVLSQAGKKRLPPKIK
mmetsp:Transcript_37036/g.72285  ORF Transcript_37036/g.72285 Transcript_37036/m.72285 type:complete len:350 (+) Transcript_37036:123-1172(+)|eukprot:CAMPEP_0173395170 /NCGR_PEP_ID=MMETSP1356-20130122/31163_1 /TAXON_ID=77927 ORGANISM="Hemiselmis virescens, Strain PCC157" /NCGR_SAMPLE_ID=MMETSP1356 /ASSEMBLY_ACC=CAM_ASM_000847 /LENGTH=349 /DNA_ID=CAMNT_0014353821 /DNA_START=54 /DNA_END=1103 /DNA_ORIENTATION=-